MKSQYLIGAFNNDSIILDSILLLIKTFDIDYIIETGSGKGCTTECLAINCPTIHIDTIENNNERYSYTSARLAPYKNVRCLMGSSDVILNNIVTEIKSKRILFYLDAHWEGEQCPLHNELQYISEHFKDNCCIVIDDFQVPNRNFHYDSYSYYSLSLKYILADIYKIYTEPCWFFNDNSNRIDPNTNTLLNAVGKIYIYPSEWNSKFEILPYKEENGYYYAI
jgi:hypothetical protein